MTEIDTNREALVNIFGYQVRTGHDIQSGKGTNAPALIWADADYEVGDGTCGLHVSQKQANEPSIPYVRFDALTAALDEIERLQEVNRLVLAANTLREEYHALPNEKNRPGQKESRKSRAKRLWLRAFSRAARAALKGGDQ